jgi:hypothetical protein
MIKIQQEGCPVYFKQTNDGFLVSAHKEFPEFYTSIHLSNWTPEQLRYVADTLEEARKNGGRLVMEIKGEGE